jgi:hypothetical protein
MNSAYRANISTCTTIGADRSVDFVNVTSRNCFYRAFADAGSASSTIIRNYVSHFIYFFGLTSDKFKVIFMNQKTNRENVQKFKSDIN